MLAVTFSPSFISVANIFRKTRLRAEENMGKQIALQLIDKRNVSVQGEVFASDTYFHITIPEPLLKISVLY